MKEAAVTTAAPAKKPRRPKGGPVTPKGASPQARRQAAAILEVLAGVRRPTEAAEILATSLPRYYQLERRALLGLLAACEPVARGPGVDPLRRVTALERENRQLKRECDRQQALVRATERSFGLVLPVTKSPGKGKQVETPATNGKSRRRARRPTVRALKAVEMLKLPEETVTETTPPLATVEV